jgi:thiamine kinase-like enzyme
VPRQEVTEHDDVLFVTQEFMAGDPVGELGPPLVDDLLALHDAQLGLARAGDPDHWADDLIETLVVGGNGYCLHDSLHRYDDRTKRLIERVEELGRSLNTSDLPATDVVHYDLHAGNLLQNDGRLAAIVDLDFTQIGDAGFDLTTLAVSSLESARDPDVRDRLFASVAELPPLRRSAYIAHLLVRILDWPIRKGRRSDVEFWLAQAERLFPETS